MLDWAFLSVGYASLESRRHTFRDVDVYISNIALRMGPNILGDLLVKWPISGAGAPVLLFIVRRYRAPGRSD
jgi:hypothetical protein